MGTLRCTCRLSQRCGPVPKLLWADLLSCGHRSLLQLLWVWKHGHDCRLLARSVVVTSTTQPVCLFVQEQDAEKKAMNRTARAWYKRYAYSAKLDRIVDHNEGPKSTGAKGYVCPGIAKSTGAIFPLPLWVRRLRLMSMLKVSNTMTNISLSPR